MLDKKVIKDIQSLKLKKHRQERGLFVAEGPKIVDELLQAMPAQIVALYATDAWVQQRPGVPAIQVSDIELGRISFLQTPNEVLCVLRMEEPEEPMVGGDRWSVYLDTIQDPGNMGTIIRICDWFGVNAIVCSNGCVDWHNPKVVQATMGSIARVPVWYDTGGSWLEKQAGPILAAVLDGTPVYQTEAVASGTLVIGNESTGISDDVLKRCTGRISIPKKGQAESLNAGVATGILLSHLVK
jgi:TrmH family RNA methyltransferase